MAPIQRFSVEEARRVGTALGINWQQVDPEQFRRGMEVELEHGIHGHIQQVARKVAAMHAPAGIRVMDADDVIAPSGISAIGKDRVHGGFCRTPNRLK